MSLIGERPVGRLGDETRADAARVLLADLRLERGGNQDVTLGLQDRAAVRNLLGIGKVPHATVLAQMLRHALDRQSHVVHKGAVALDDADDLRAVLLLEEARRVVAHVAEPLDDHPLALEAALEPGFLDVFRMAEAAAPAP